MRPSMAVCSAWVIRPVAETAGSWWLTDPVFSERASPLPFAGPKRFHAPPVALADLPPIRGELSHDH